MLFRVIDVSPMANVSKSTDKFLLNNILKMCCVAGACSIVFHPQEVCMNVHRVSGVINFNREQLQISQKKGVAMIMFSLITTIVNGLCSFLDYILILHI